MSLEDALQHEHDRGRKHVAVVVQHIPRVGRLGLGDAQAVLSLLDDPAAAGVDRPEVHVRASQVLLAQQPIHEAAHVLGDVLRQVLGQRAGDTVVVDGQDDAILQYDMIVL